MLAPAAHGHEHARGADECRKRVAEFVARVYEFANFCVPDGSFADVGLDDRLEPPDEVVGVFDPDACHERTANEYHLHVRRAARRQLDATLYGGDANAFENGVIDPASGFCGGVDLPSTSRCEAGDVAVRFTLDFKPGFAARIDDGFLSVRAQNDGERSRGCFCQ